MKRSQEKELMDLPGNPVDLLEGDLRNLRLLNRTLGGYRGILQGLEFVLDKNGGAPLSILDVGTGSADIPAAIVRRARRRGISVRVIALEADPVTATVARRQTKELPEVSVVCGDALNIPFRTAAFDLVFCSQLLHHFSEGEILSLLRTWSGLARRAILVSDLIRHPLAYAAIRFLTLLCTRNAMTRTDAPLSVRRAFTLAEWRALFRRAGIGDFYLHPVFPFRLLAFFSLRG